MPTEISLITEHGERTFKGLQLFQQNRCMLEKFHSPFSLIISFKSVYPVFSQKESTLFLYLLRNFKTELHETPTFCFKHRFSSDSLLIFRLGIFLTYSQHAFIPTNICKRLKMITFLSFKITCYATSSVKLPYLSRTELDL